MARRTGLPTMISIAQNMCRLIAKFTPVIQQLYGDNELLMAALVAMNAACGEFVIQASDVIPLGD